jgi:hypothetical protein
LYLLKKRKKIDMPCFIEEKQERAKRRKDKTGTEIKIRSSKKKNHETSAKKRKEETRAGKKAIKN